MVHSTQLSKNLNNERFFQEVKLMLALEKHILLHYCHTCLLKEKVTALYVHKVVTYYSINCSSQVIFSNSKTEGCLRVFINAPNVNTGSDQFI